MLDSWDLTGTGTLRRSLERDFPLGDVKGAYQLPARLAPEVARRVHPNNHEAILNVLLRRMAGQADHEVAAPFAFGVYGLDRGKRRPSGGSRRRGRPDPRRAAGGDRRARPPVPPRRSCSPARAPTQRGVGDTWVSRVRPCRRVDREGNRGTRQRRPRRRASRSARPHLGVLKTAAVVVPRAWRVEGRPPIRGENHRGVPAVNRARIGNIACPRASHDLLRRQ
jgi:hypothetical protein